MNPFLDLQVCLASIGVVADLCRELKVAILPYCDDIMMLLFQNLSVSGSSFVFYSVRNFVSKISKNLRFVGQLGAQICQAANIISIR